MTVPASLFVATNPSVLSVGGADLVLNGMFLTTSTRVPIGTVAQFPDVTTVTDYFGGGSTEAAQAAIYFGGWDGSLQKPGNMLFTQYNTAAVAAYLRGGDISALALATLQTYSATLTVVVDGISRSAPIVLSSATSFSSAAGIIQTGLNTTGIATIASFTGVIGPSSTTLTTSAVTGVIAPGQAVIGSGVTAGTYILSQLGGTPGGAGTYQVSASQTVGSEAMTTQAFPVAVTYDSVSGALSITSGITGPLSTAAFATGSMATLLLLTSATGAVLSQGAVSASPSAFMTALASAFSNWATFGLLFDPDGGSGFANKLLFSEWVDGTNGRFAYSAYDVDAGPAASTPDTGSFGYALQQADLSGTVLHGSEANSTAPALNVATLFQGMVASVDFEQTGGRVTFAYKAQSGITPTCTTETAFLNFSGNPQSAGSFGNGYNVYAAIASANATFQNYQRSTISGPFKWSDAYINAIWLTNTLQIDLLNLFAAANSIPFNATGSGMIRTALSPTIQQGLSFGAYAPGVTLSGSQIASVNGSAGFDIATPLQNQGWFLLVRPASAAVRANRGPWQVVLFYVDAGSVQSIALSTVALQ
jgi:hypothetical protein